MKNRAVKIERSGHDKNLEIPQEEGPELTQPNNKKGQTIEKSDFTFYRGFLLMILADSFIWAKSSIEKILDQNFVNNISSTLSNFASENPYPFYKNFLESTAIQNSEIFGLLIIFGESFAALTMIFTALILLIKPYGSKFLAILLSSALFIASFLSLNFFLASGWISPSSYSLNLLMLFIQIIALIFILKSSLNLKQD